MRKKNYETCPCCKNLSAEDKDGKKVESPEWKSQPYRHSRSDFDGKPKIIFP